MIRFQMADFQEIEGLPILLTQLNLKCETLVWPLHILHFILQMIPWAVDRLSGFMEIPFQQSHLLLALKTPWKLERVRQECVEMKHAQLPPLGSDLQ